MPERLVVIKVAESGKVDVVMKDHVSRREMLAVLRELPKAYSRHVREYRKVLETLGKKELSNVG